MIQVFDNDHYLLSHIASPSPILLIFFLPAGCKVDFELKTKLIREDNYLLWRAGIVRKVKEKNRIVFILKFSPCRIYLISSLASICVCNQPM